MIANTSTCGYCAWEIFNESQLPCGHQVHNQCLQAFAKQKSDQNFDPQVYIRFTKTLQTLVCPICEFPIGLQYVQLIISHQKLDQYRQLASLKAIENIKKSSQMERQKQLENKVYQCPVCQEQKKINQYVSLSCEKDPHRICKSCVEMLIKSKISEGKFKEKDITCPMCNSPIDEIVIKYCIDKQSFDKIMNRRHNELDVPGLEFRKCRGYLFKKNKQPLMIPKANMTGKQNNTFQDQLERRCNALRNGIKLKQIVGDVQQCTCVISYDRQENKHDRYIKCNVCLLQMCIRGCDSSHKGNTCEKYKQWIDLNKKGDKVLEQAIKSAGMAKCQNPKCAIPILKQVGCNWVQCRCGWQICYICSKTWTPKDIHFAGGGHNQFNQKAFLARQK